DRDQPAVIDADEAEFDFKTGVRTYRGNVSVVQGSLRINADKLIVQFKDGKMETATAWGAPAKFQQRPDGKDHDVIGIGKTIELDQPANTLTLINTASLKQGADTAQGAKIIYNMAKDTLKVQGGSRIETRPSADLKQPSSGAPPPPAAGRARVVIPAKKTQTTP
ncbi:MAG: lipopolysaccharide transport periplasmic protein LptA, partial [Gammaproteobacteria bacterium]|nr:lipopolysaccharide transport periplasmic protein LptA [Gammaproteobacteria bacterium]